ncbi:MAG: hypothetical protein HY817_02805 [Candidatus Abawacabacteria bacterium]|nr:hypothetical protein [Candidatus Abawacabacteria bacterium]
MSDQEKKIAAISYVPGLSIVCLWGRTEHFVRFHARQALVLHVFFLLWLFLPWWWLTMILELGVFGLIVLGFYHASLGAEYELPVVKELLARKK